MPDLRPSIASALSAFGLPATVTRQAPADTTPIGTIGMWLPPTTEDVVGGADFTRRETLYVFVLPRVSVTVGGHTYAGVPTMPIKTRVAAPPVEGGTPGTWQVDQLVFGDVDHWRVLLLPVTT